MENKNYLLGYLKNAQEKPNADYHLSFGMREEMNFFRNQELAENWSARLSYFDQIDKSLSPIFEAVYFYGKWKKEKDFGFALKSLEKFREMEEISYKKNWFWVLSFCITEQVNVCFELKRDDDLKNIGRRIVNYLIEGKDSFQPHTFGELTRQFTRLLEIVENELTEKVYRLVMDYLQTIMLNSSFQEGFINEALAIKKAQRNKEAVKELHRKILDLKINKADEKGSKLLLHGLLEDALT